MDCCVGLNRHSLSQRTNPTDPIGDPLTSSPAPSAGYRLVEWPCDLSLWFMFVWCSAHSCSPQDELWSVCWSHGAVQGITKATLSFQRESSFLNLETILGQNHFNWRWTLLYSLGSLQSHLTVFIMAPLVITWPISSTKLQLLLSFICLLIHMNIYLFIPWISILATIAYVC